MVTSTARATAGSKKECAPEGTPGAQAKAYERHQKRPQQRRSVARTILHLEGKTQACKRYRHRDRIGPGRDGVGIDRGGHTLRQAGHREQHCCYTNPRAGPQQT